MHSSTIKAIAYSLPSNVITNNELEKRFGSKAVQSISKMSGIKERRVVSANLCASDLAFDAAQRLINHLNLDRSSIDLLTFTSQTPDYRMPATAAVLHGRLGLAESCSAFDINQACSSFIHTIQVVHSMIVAGTAKRALVLIGDAVSTMVNPLDRGLVTLHGDAAAAALIEPYGPDEGGIEYIEVCTDGTKYDKLYVPAGGARIPSCDETRTDKIDDDGCVRTMEQIYMDGPAVFHFCVYRVADFLKKAIAKMGLTVDKIDLVLLHQANKTMIDYIYSAVGIPPGKRHYLIKNVGNCGGASLPVLLAHAWREGIVKPGSRTLLCGFGAGLSWGAFSIKWPGNADAAVPGDVIVPNPTGKRGHCYEQV